MRAMLIVFAVRFALWSSSVAGYRLQVRTPAVELVTWVRHKNNSALLYNLPSGSWLAWVNDTAPIARTWTHASASRHTTVQSTNHSRPSPRSPY